MSDVIPYYSRQSPDDVTGAANQSEAPIFRQRLNAFEEVLAPCEATFYCEFESRLDPLVTWLKDDDEVRMGDVSLEVDSTGYVYSTRLTLREVTINDSGAYRCLVENTEGIISTTGYLSVTSYDDFPSIHDDQLLSLTYTEQVDPATPTSTPFNIYPSSFTRPQALQNTISYYDSTQESLTSVASDFSNHLYPDSGFRIPDSSDSLLARYSSSSTMQEIKPPGRSASYPAGDYHPANTSKTTNDFDDHNAASPTEQLTPNEAFEVNVFNAPNMAHSYNGGPFTTRRHHEINASVDTSNAAGDLSSTRSLNAFGTLVKNFKAATNMEHTADISTAKRLHDFGALDDISQTATYPSEHSENRGANYASKNSHINPDLQFAAHRGLIGISNTFDASANTPAYNRSYYASNITDNNPEELLLINTHRQTHVINSDAHRGNIGISNTCDTTANTPTLNSIYYASNNTDQAPRGDSNPRQIGPDARYLDEDGPCGYREDLDAEGVGIHGESEQKNIYTIIHPRGMTRTITISSSQSSGDYPKMDDVTNVNNIYLNEENSFIISNSDNRLSFEMEADDVPRHRGDGIEDNIKPSFDNQNPVLTVLDKPLGSLVEAHAQKSELVRDKTSHGWIGSSEDEFQLKKSCNFLNFENIPTSLALAENAAANDLEKDEINSVIASVTADPLHVASEEKLTGSRLLNKLNPFGLNTKSIQNKSKGLESDVNAAISADPLLFASEEKLTGPTLSNKLNPFGLHTKSIYEKSKGLDNDSEAAISAAYNKGTIDEVGNCVINDCDPFHLELANNELHDVQDNLFKDNHNYLEEKIKYTKVNNSKDILASTNDILDNFDYDFKNYIDPLDLEPGVNIVNVEDKDVAFEFFPEMFRTYKNENNIDENIASRNIDLTQTCGYSTKDKIESNFTNMVKNLPSDYAVRINVLDDGGGQIRIIKRCFCEPHDTSYQRIISELIQTKFHEFLSSSNEVSDEGKKDILMICPICGWEEIFDDEEAVSKIPEEEAFIFSSTEAASHPLIGKTQIDPNTLLSPPKLEFPTSQSPDGRHFGGETWRDGEALDSGEVVMSKTEAVARAASSSGLVRMGWRGWGILIGIILMGLACFFLSNNTAVYTLSLFIGSFLVFLIFDLNLF